MDNGGAAHRNYERAHFTIRRPGGVVPDLVCTTETCRTEARQRVQGANARRKAAQFTINAFLFYRQPRWDVQINFFNITDERNWTSIDPSFAGNDVIYPEQPFRISGQLRLKF